MSEITQLFQYNTLGALMSGLYEGTMTIGELLKHGDLGIGTLDSIDGELIILDGKAYQAKGDKTITELEEDVRVPYAAVVHHRAEVTFKQRFAATDKELEERMESYFDGQNLFRSIKIEGLFSKIHVRMIPRAKEGTKFVDVSQHQPEYFEENVQGTIVGIWTPKMFHGVSVAGYHLHFISDDHTFGGHVLDFVMENGKVEIGAIDQLNQSFPVQDRKFLFADLDIEELKKDIDIAE
ncbi:acetolactate decarboxylase [Lactococcus kimchii]|uniref:acetolactate decarboxylase n=1 Tax=Lactococcus sp. S-13 TaxID=2507158 RepID=UPI0010237F7E|nr:acetolactate decarboxylase [Lactococcus sp. S-13]RZI48209.1 acetolactate decarboxylase [Lactococcus sp. S-13]